MPLTVVKKWNSIIGSFNAIDSHTRHAAIARLGYGDMVFLSTFNSEASFFPEASGLP